MNREVRKARKAFDFFLAPFAVKMHEPVLSKDV
jgi:hypothetical protein